MRRRYLLVSLLLVLVVPVHAQDLKSSYYRRFEIGWDVFTYLHQVDENLFGANLSFAVRKSDRLAFVTEGSYHRDDVVFGDEFYSYHFGPRFYAKPKGRLQPFMEILAGGSHLYQSTLPLSFGATAQQGTTDWSGFELLAGGGVDMRIKPWFAWRTVQTDYSFLHLAGDSSSGFRINSGILFRFGH